MEKDKRTGWLRKLKVGDKVAIEINRYASYLYKIATITKITPTGLIKTNNSVFDQNGRDRNNDLGCGRYLKEITDDIVKEIYIQNYKHKIKTNWGYLLNLSDEKDIKQVNELLEKGCVIAEKITRR